MPATTSPPTNPPRDGKIRHIARCRLRTGPQGFSRHDGVLFPDRMVRRPPDRGGRDPVQEVGDDGVPRGDDVGNFPLHPGGFEEPAHQAVHPRKEPTPQQFEPAGRLLDEHDAGDQILAAPHLRIVRRRAGQDGSVREIHERAGQGARPEIQRHPERNASRRGAGKGKERFLPRQVFPVEERREAGGPAPGKDRHGDVAADGEAAAREADPRGDFRPREGPRILSAASLAGHRDPAFSAPVFPAARREERDTGTQGVGKERFPRDPGNVYSVGKEADRPRVVRHERGGRRPAGGGAGTTGGRTTPAGRRGPATRTAPRSGRRGARPCREG